MNVPVYLCPNSGRSNESSPACYFVHHDQIDSTCVAYILLCFMCILPKYRSEAPVVAVQPHKLAPIRKAGLSRLHVDPNSQVMFYLIYMCIMISAFHLTVELAAE